jgi:hypothetical protein
MSPNAEWMDSRIHYRSSACFRDPPPRARDEFSSCSRFRAFLSIANSGYRTRYPLAVVDLAPLLDGSTAVELIPEPARHGLEWLIEMEDAAVVGAQHHERTEERLCLLNGYRARTLSTR